MSDSGSARHLARRRAFENRVLRAAIDGRLSRLCWLIGSILQQVLLKLNYEWHRSNCTRSQIDIA